MAETRSFQPVDLEGAFALLAEMTQQFADAMDLEKTLARGLESIAAAVGAEAGSLWLIENEGREIVCQASGGPNPINGPGVARNAAQVRATRTPAIRELLASQASSRLNAVAQVATMATSWLVERNSAGNVFVLN